MAVNANNNGSAFSFVSFFEWSVDFIKLTRRARREAHEKGAQGGSREGLATRLTRRA